MKRVVICVSIVGIALTLIISLAFWVHSNLSEQAHAAAISWDGGGDGTSWSDGANWSGDSVPGADDDVTIDADVTVDIAASSFTPIAHWKMNDNAANTDVDDSIGSNDGDAQQNTSSLTTSGKVNQALTFNGSSDYIDAGSPNLGLTNNMSVAFWINPTTGNGVIMSHGYNYLSEEYGWAVHLGTNNHENTNNRSISWSSSDNSGNYNGAVVVQTATDSINLSEWQYVAITKEGTTIKIYINGELSTTGSISVSTIAYPSGYSLTIGKQVDETCYMPYFNGALDDIRIYDDVLSETIVKAIYNSGSGTETSTLTTGSSIINSLTLGNAGGTTAPTLNFIYDAIGGSALIIDDGDLTVYSNADITHDTGDAGVNGTIYIDVQTGSATINGTVNVNGKGYAISQGAGQGGDYNNGGGGGGHGGIGGDGRGATGGTNYGSITAPINLGSGGGAGEYAIKGAGGGAIRLTVAGTTTVAGSISVNGENGQTSGDSGGAGGSIYLTTGILAGSGSITANGGTASAESYNRWSGGGAGGRIAMYYTTDSSSLTALTTYGGAGSSGAGINGAGFAGAGTIYKKATAQSNGDLIIDNNNQSPNTDNYYKYGWTPLDTNSTFDTVELRNVGELEIETGVTLNYTTLTWNDDGVLTENGTVNFGNDLTVPQGATYNANVSKSFDNLTVQGIITTWRNTTSEMYKFDFTVNNNLEITGTGSINLNSKGYAISYGPGQGGDYGSGGGEWWSL